MRIICQDKTSEAIVARAKNHDLIILRSIRCRTAGGLAVSDISERIVRGFKGSSILFGEPHFYHHAYHK